MGLQRCLRTRRRRGNAFACKGDVISHAINEHLYHQYIYIVNRIAHCLIPLKKRQSKHVLVLLANIARIQKLYAGHAVHIQHRVCPRMRTHKVVVFDDVVIKQRRRLLWDG
ncbi:hypothetical protein BRADI_3g39886v3 [Brachypodium distachyon]|uniref:Uncharacterized protein n=1 Tax=Brachypodium distachyon TaxID=15368 RepID=A0A0Q3FGW5_BRADI|nr:hypothetical protein BRADI_3g39886v3 [Brachypodium distachyon]